MQDVYRKLDSRFKTALVTGGAGFVGSHICEQLVKNTSLNVVSLDDYSAGKQANIQFLKASSKFHDVKCDVSDQAALPRVYEQYGIDLVFHNAASKKSICIKSPARDLEVNSRGTLNVVDLAYKYKVKKFVHASTGSVYGEAVILPQDEHHPLNPVSYYGVSKLAAEKYVKLYHSLYGFDTTVLRYFHIFGSRQESNEYGGVVAIFIRKMLEGKLPVIFGDGTQERSFTYVVDVANANFIVATDERSKGEIYNCASGISVTIQQLCDSVLAYYGMKGKVEPVYEDWMIGDIKKFQMSNAKLRALGMTFETNFEERLKETIRSMEPYLKDMMAAEQR